MYCYHSAFAGTSASMISYMSVSMITTPSPLHLGSNDRLLSSLTKTPQAFVHEQTVQV